MSKKRNRRPMPTPPTAPEAVTPDAAAVVADAQSLVSDEPEAQTPDAAKAVAETVPTRAYVKSLRALSAQRVKARINPTPGAPPTAPPTPPSTPRFGLDPRFVENATRGRKQGDTAPRATINASDLKA